MKHIVVNFFGFIVYDYKSLVISFPNEYHFYNEITDSQKKILLKLDKKRFKFICFEGGKNLCKNKKRYL